MGAASPPDEIRITLGTADDFPALARVEDEAGGLFLEAGLASIAEMEATDSATHQRGIDEGHLWVARTSEDAIGFALARAYGLTLHLQEMAVSPRYGRRGIGTLLLRTVEQVARAEGFERVTLTTFLDIPWNAPFYQRYGFVILDEDQESDDLRRIRAHEKELGLDVSRRVCMTLNSCNANTSASR